MAHSVPLKKDLCSKTIGLGNKAVVCTLYQRGGNLEVEGDVSRLHANKILERLMEKGVEINPDDWFMKKRNPQKITFLKK